jgi:hypothetical protein
MEGGEDSHLFEVVSLNSPLDATPMATHGIGGIVGCSPTREKKKMAPRKYGSNLRKIGDRAKNLQQPTVVSSLSYISTSLFERTSTEKNYQKKTTYGKEQETQQKESRIPRRKKLRKGIWKC